MNPTPFDDKQSEQLLSACVEATVSQSITEEVQSISTDAKSPTLSFDEPGKFCNGTKKESVAETDDSFDIFLPLKVKNYKNGLKKPNNSSSTNKYKKKKVTSSNRICPYFSTRKSPTSSKEDRDLKLAIARSLEDVSPIKSSEGVLNDIVNVNKPCDNLNEKKPVRQVSNVLKSFTNKTKKPSTNTLLFRRTAEERQEIIIKKIGILLIKKENLHDQSLDKLEINLISSNLEGLWDKNSTLWELSKIEVKNLAEFYVSHLEKYIERREVSFEPPVTAMSDTDTMEGNNNVEAPPPDVMDIKMEDDSTQFMEQFQDQFKGNNEENDSECNKISEVDLHNHELSIKDKFLSDSLNILSNDLFSFFGSNELSDFNVILKTGESLPCHQFMLQARCPNLLSDILRSEDSNSLDFTQYSSKATRAFFRYIYTGKLDFVYSLPYEDKSDLYVLAKKYQLEFLENFLLKSFSADSFHVYSQSTCSPPQSPKASPDTSYGAKEDIVNKDKKLTSLAQESFQKDKETFSILKENQSMGLSFANLNETINNFASTSGLNSFKNNSERTPSNTDQSLYDIFKDEIKSPCNSSLLFPGFQSKRKLDYTDVLKETKKICSVKDPIKLEKSPEIVTIDSDSNIECLSISGSSSSQSHSEGLNNFFKVENLSKSINEDLFQNSVINSDLNLANYFSKPNEEDRTKETEISPLKSPPDSNKSSSPAIVSPAPALTSNKRSIDKYFEASFPDEVDEDIEVIEKFSQQKALATPPVNKNLSKKLLTPLQEIIVGKATPKPNYEAMISPDLKDELRKYGIKPNLDPKKARSLLQYIYEQIHPIRADLPKPVETPQASTSSARPVSPVPVIDIKDESSQSDSSDKWKNSENDFEYEEQLFNQSKVEHEFSTDKIEPRESDLRKTIADFIKSNKELFSNVVLFRPLLFKKFYSSVREHGIKCSIYELMDVLDDLCINYHVEKKENSRQKRRTKKKTVKKKPTKTS